MTESKARRPRIYLAGPEVFLPNAFAVAADKRRLAAEVGLEGVFPLDVELALRGLPKPEQAALISRSNEGLMRSCDALIANLTPFRGVSMDAGTAFEVGFMRALARPVTGYTNTVHHLAHRSRTFRMAPRHPFDADAADTEIEDFDLAENLMIEIAIQASGCSVVRTEVDSDRLMTDLTGYRECLVQLAILLPNR